MNEPQDPPPVPSHARHEPYVLAARALVFTAFFLMASVALGPGLERAPAWVQRLVVGLPPELASLSRGAGSVVYLGDSVVNVVAPGEDGATPLAALVAARCRLDLVRSSHLAYGPAEHLAQVRYMTRRGIRPRAIVLPVNLRAFAPHWTERPAWSFAARRLMLETGLYGPIRLLAAFKHGFGRLTEAEFDALPVRVAGRELGTLGALDGDFERPAESPAQVRGRYLARYATDIQSGDRVAALAATLSEVAGEGITTVVYLTPLDLDRIAEELRPEEMRCVQANLAVLRGVIQRSGVPWIDLSGAIRSAGFFHDPTNPNDHIRLASRTVVADAVAARLRELVGCP